MAMNGFWRSQPDSKSIFKILNENIEQLIINNPTSLPNLSSTSTILVSSDYSGEHSGSKYQILSFLIADTGNCEQWDKEREEVRAEFLSNNRRMSFKELRDNQKFKALKPFLSSADRIPGLVFTVAIESSIQSLFEGLAPLDLENPEFLFFKSWRPNVLEKAFRILHFISFLLAGISHPGQNIIWFTDEDSIAANPDRLRQLTNLFSWVISPYLAFDLGHLRCGTTKCDDGSRRIEDLTAIPDLVAGAIGEQLQLQYEKKPDTSNIFWIQRSDFTQKTSFITWWLADTTKPLKRLFCKIDLLKTSNKLNVSWFHFHNQI
jgi:hypothetical protein